MTIKSLKKLQLITVLLFILTILIIIAELLLLGLFHGKEVVTIKSNHLVKNTKPLIYEYNGFTLWSKYSWYYILTNNNICLNNFGSYYIIHNYYNYSLLSLKIAIIFFYNCSSNFYFYNFVINIFHYWFKKENK
ncbi:hypothetical protein [Spiroplasma endosymbiont of Dactylopius coccus]